MIWLSHIYVGIVCVYRRSSFFSLSFTLLVIHLFLFSFLFSSFPSFLPFHYLSLLWLQPLSSLIISLYSCRHNTGTSTNSHIQPTNSLALPKETWTTQQHDRNQYQRHCYSPMTNDIHNHEEDLSDNRIFYNLEELQAPALQQGRQLSITAMPVINHAHTVTGSISTH